MGSAASFIERFCKKEAIERKKEIERLQVCTDIISVERTEELKRVLLKMLAQEEDHWKQIAKLLWLQEGDANTRFFHAHANARKMRNKISRLTDENGSIVSEQSDICRVAGDYFKDIFAPLAGNLRPVVDLLEQKVTGTDNDFLLLPFQRDEFFRALK